MIRCPVSCIVQVCRYSAANAADQDGDVHRGEAIEPVQVAGRDVAVDGDLDQVRLRQRRAGADEDGDERQRDLTASTGSR